MQSTLTVEEAAKVLSEGGVVLYPTETVYGVAASIRCDEAVERVYDLKQRSREKPLSVAFPTVDAALDWTAPSMEALEFMREVLPGAVTVLVPNEGVSDVVVASSDLVGVRVSSDEDVQRLTSEAGPVTSTSANVSGEAPATTQEELDPRLVEPVDGVVEGEMEDGEGLASTVVDTKAWEIVRRGADVEHVQTLVDDFGETDS